jgi:SAM-dependent methyltransferase
MTSFRSRKRFPRAIERVALRAIGVVSSSPDGAQAPDADRSSDPPSPPPPLPPSPTHVLPEPGAPARFARDAEVTWLAAERFAATTRLYECLSAQEVAEIERMIDESPDLARDYAAIPDPGTRRQMVLAYGIWLGHPAVAEKTGLPGQQPPEDVHAMARGPSAAAGGVYEADLVANALASVGVDIAHLQNALDFGCSSGRVLRVLRAAYPGTTWHGCDPNARAIEWVSENLPDVQAFVSSHAPPLSLAGGSLDMAYAISIWSHFAPALGLRWFDEMHRIIRPGGHLVLTTHGMTSVAFYALRSLRTPLQCDEIIGDLYRHGWWYAAEFGQEGDWGVINPDWGTAFVSPEWMLTQLCPRWRVLEFAPGRNQDNQDVYVLQRL